MKSSKWPDFIFTVVVRFVCGFVLGALACLLVSYRGILRAFSHDNTRTPLIWLAVCSLLGAIIAVVTVPYWQRPWYKGISDRHHRG
jgi:heme/copper-type cytochrome/quinol oxidase subunit 2